MKPAPKQNAALLDPRLRSTARERREARIKYAGKEEEMEQREMEQREEEREEREKERESFPTPVRALRPRRGESQIFRLWREVGVGKP